jgi:sarcosine oxidase subunit gamma
VSAPEPISPLDHHLHPGRFGAAGRSGVQIGQRRVAIAQVIARKGQGDAVGDSIERLIGLRLPEPGRSAGTDAAAVWIGPETWLLLRPAGPDFVADIANACGSAASVVDQSAGKAVLRVSGDRARDVLAKGCRVDLHPRVFGPGSSAVTPIGHIQVVISQVDATPRFDVIVPSTLAEDFLEWLCLSAAEFGYEIVAG